MADVTAIRPAVFDDEIYVTYDSEGERNLVTTGSIPVYREAAWGDVPASSVQEGVPIVPGAGSSGVPGASELLPSATSARERSGDDTTVLPVYHGDSPRNGSGSGAGHRAEDSRESVDGAASYRWGAADGPGVSQRANVYARRVRPHKHCPGCVGHGGRVRRGWGFGWRALLAIFFGWFAIDAAGFAGWEAAKGVTFPAYLLVVGLGGWAVILMREAWRRANVDE